MKRNHENHIRGFYIIRESWYFKPHDLHTYTDSINLGMYSPDGGGCSGEFSIQWEVVCNKETPTLKSFDDGWSSLTFFYDFLEILAERDSEDLTREDIKEILLSLGVKDLTQREMVR